ncbi:MAG: hypothetical protein H0U76_07360 [Ktedonobacteraceae bacterium]|nr:hypothetical protein [Ktedonobacteraceae bacterium]
MSNLLVFSPYATRPHFTAYEGTIAKACQVRGATVEYLLCDGLLPECDMHWDSFPLHHPRPLDICERCTAGAKARIAEFELPYKWLGEFITKSEREEAFVWAQGLAVSEICKATYLTYPIAEWVQSSIYSYFRQFPADMSNWRVVNAYRGFLLSGALVSVGLRRYLETHPVDCALLFNGRQSITRVAFELLREANIRVLTHEMPFYQSGHIMVKPNARCWSNQPFADFWRDWGNIPLTRVAMQETLKWLVDRRYGRNLSWFTYNPSVNFNVTLRSHLKLTEGKKLLALFTSSTEETAGDTELESAYAWQSTWVQDVLDWVRKRDDVELVIRVHPHLSGGTGLTRAFDEFSFYEKMKVSAPSNTRVIMPDEPLNSYALMSEADVGLTFGSTVGIEMAMLGKPVVLAARNFYEVGTHIIKVRSRETLGEDLERSLGSFSARELRREAFRMAYYYAFAFELPFPLVSVFRVMDVKRNYSGTKALERGQDETLDHICNYLLETGPLFDSPTAADKTRSLAEEDAFLEWMEKTPDCLRDRNYERLLPIFKTLRGMGRMTKRAIRKMPFGSGNALLQAGQGFYRSFAK